MHKLFEYLLISSPNGGGLFFSDGSEVVLIDTINTTGFFYQQDIVLRAVQPNTLIITKGKHTFVCSGESADFYDVHDVLWHDGYCYLVATDGNEIIKLSIDGEELQRWVFPGDKDSWHINCLGLWHDRIIFSGFGDFREHRSYKGKTAEAGFVQDIISGEKLICGLSQPHSLVTVDDRLFLANSEQMELIEFSSDGKIARSKQLNKYTRGVCIHENIVYVGLSCSRNVDYKETAMAELVALDFETFEELDRIQVPAKEIYDIRHLSNKSDIVRVLVAIGSMSLSAAEEQNQRLATEINTVLHTHNEHKTELTTALQAAEEQNQRLAVELERILKSHSWKLTRPLRIMVDRLRGIAK
jgi:hypothetical protein